ncbi:SLC13 family permease [Belliella sp. R4-6]|uniref:SLC13 family permease n=1 Tax=Belliella alkalica TaxID=1730871 RepID=A0ABS9VB48_9BACT|nr:SLC13 family permease [Belliella alkalica]MCH7413651.1 SLC13 family permease [Belliella alkalica]
MEKEIVFGILVLAIFLFSWGKLRHDLVAIICLLLLVITGLIPADESFNGFAHPAVITVAMILVVSHGLAKSGLIEWLAKLLMEKNFPFTVQLAILCGMVCIASAFMNNVGALAMTMPLAIHIANKNGESPSSYLMPISFASLLGGMTTLIGTPPNIIISTFMAEQSGEKFSMFDFAPVGVGLAIVGLLFIVLIGWRLVPKRASNEDEKNKFKIDDYITEVQIVEDSKLIDEPHRSIHQFTKGNIQVLNIIRGGQMTYAPGRNFVFRENDVITIQGDPDDIKSFIDDSKTSLVGKEKETGEDVKPENITLVEAVVMSNANIINTTAAQLYLSYRYGINLLAISRQNQKISKRIDHVKFQVGDVLLVQGDQDKVDEAIERMGCLPLADRKLNLGQPKKILLSVGIFTLSLALIISGLLPVQIAFTIAALLMVIFKIFPIRELYKSIDWPVIILLGALLPLGTALETSGGASWIAEQLLTFKDSMPAWTILALVLIITMFLSDVINNAATVVLMAPIALNIASGMQVNIEPFLMAVAVGGSCAFLTPIGHQSNTLVMGPGGYKFTDYLRLGAPLEIILILVGIPLILLFWPL